VNKELAKPTQDKIVFIKPIILIFKIVFRSPCLATYQRIGDPAEKRFFVHYFS